jgi:stress-induced morphogen
VQATIAVNRAELRRYLERIGSRWRLDGAYLGGSALTGESGGESLSDRHSDSLGDRHSEFTIVLVSDAFDEIPWLERVYVANSLWDALEMGAPADVHCYTRAEFERRRDTTPAVRDATWHGLDLLVFI